MKYLIIIIKKKLIGKSKNLNIQLRKNCYEPMTQKQQDAICKSMQYNE